MTLALSWRPGWARPWLTGVEGVSFAGIQTVSSQGNRKVETDHPFSWRMKGFNSIQFRSVPMNGVDSLPPHSDD
jgi:hypothetical protein